MMTQGPDRLAALVWLASAPAPCARLPRDIPGGGSSFGTAASFTCRVVGFIICRVQGAGGGNHTIEQQ